MLTSLGVEPVDSLSRQGITIAAGAIGATAAH